MECQKGDWNNHWQWCQERLELRQRCKKEQKKKVEEEKKSKAFSTDSLAFALD